MATTISLSFEDTFNVYDYVTEVRIGQISVVSDGWAAYQATPGGRQIIEKRVGTYEHADIAVRVLDRIHKNSKVK